MSAAKRQKLMAKTTKTFTNLSAPRQIVNVVNGRKSSTQTTIIGPAISKQQPFKVLPQALGPLMEPAGSPESVVPEEKSQLHFVKETQSQVSKFDACGWLLLIHRFSAREASQRIQ